jgi:glucose/arabinose dehydrogenase/mono/diheme cytochrome c family protein
MKKGMLIISVAVLSLLHLSSCNSNTSSDNIAISTDSATIAKGKASFTQSCSGCHNFRQDAIGPALGGLTDSVSADWIQHYIRDPKKMIESGDKRAQQLIKKYKVAMPSFTSFTDDEMKAIIAYLNTHKKHVKPIARADGKGLSDPIPDTIKLSNLVVGLELMTQFPASVDSGKGPRARITKLGFEPHTGTSFILDLQGKLYKLQNNKPIVYMDMAKLKPKFINEPGLATGFGSFAFHPEFAKNGLLYTTHTEAPGSGKADFSYNDSIDVTLQWVLTEWKTDQPGATTFSGNGRELFRANFVTGIHGVQEITFNPLSKPGDEDYGLLYIGVGDGGSVEEGFQFLAHSKDKIWGSILRIDPRGSNSANGQYGIPQSNPFVKDQKNKTLGEIYAYGFRNPHRITWSKSGEMLACNIGHSNIESVNLIMPGHDYGWPIREGTFLLDPYADLTKLYPLPANDSIYKITYPVAEFDHNGNSTAISGGYEYWGTTIPQLKGKFLFGDIASGRLYYIELGDVKQGKQATIKEWKISIKGLPKTLTELTGTDRADLHFGRDARGEMYILTKTDGKLYKLVSAGTKTNGQ